MPLRDRVKVGIKQFQGLKSAMPIESYGLESASQCENFVLKDGQLRKVFGNEVYASILDSQSGGTRSLHRFQLRWIAQRGSALAIESEEHSANFDEVIKSDLISTNRLYSTLWRDRIFFLNGIDADYYLKKQDISAYGRLGLDPPPYSAGFSAITSVSNAGNIPVGTYYYFLTFYDENTNTESPAFGSAMSQNGLFELSPNAVLGPLPWVEATVAATTKKIEITGTDGVFGLIPYLSFAQNLVPRATHFILYRAEKLPDGLYDSTARVPLKNGGSQDGNVLIRISDFMDEELDFIDNTETLDQVALPENNSPPPTVARAQTAFTQAATIGIKSGGTSPTSATASGYRHARVWRDQLFGIGAKAPGFQVTEAKLGVDSDQRVTGTVCDFSDILFGSEVFQPDYATFVWEVSRGDGQEAVGVAAMGDTALLVFKTKSTHYLAGSSADNYILRPMDTQKGAVHESTIQETPFGVITLDRSGWVVWNKIGQGEPASVSIQDIIDRIDFQYAANFYSFYNPKEQRYGCAVCVEGSGGTPNLTCWLDLQTSEWTTEAGTEGLSRVIDTSVNYGFIDIVGSATNGRLLDFSSPLNVTNQGQPITATWKSGAIIFEDDQRKKRMRWIYLKAKTASSWKVDIEVIPDGNESLKYVLQDWDVVATQSTWYSSDVATDGSLIWDSGVWAGIGLVRQVSKIPVSCIGYSFQIRIIHKEADADRADFTIEGISAEAVMLGR